MALQDLIQSVEGIFNITSRNDGYATEKSRFTEGTLLELEDEELTYKSTARFTSEKKEICGTKLIIENERGKGEASFPMHIPFGKKLLIGQKVRYSEKSWSSEMEGTSTEYSLEVLSGNLNGEKLEERVFV